MKNGIPRSSVSSLTSSRHGRPRTPKGYDGTGVTSRTLNHLLPEVLAALMARQKERPDLIIAAWKEIVGPAIASLTEAVSFSEGILKVKVKNSALHSLLQQNEKPRLLAALKQKFPHAVFNDIQFRIG